MLVHFLIIERNRSDFSKVLSGTGEDGVPLVRWQSLVSFFAGLGMCWAMSYGALFHGPIATAMGGIDLSWLGGMVTSALVYLILAKATGIGRCMSLNE